jgi:hypothetical protein
MKKNWGHILRSCGNDCLKALISFWLIMYDLNGILSTHFYSLQTINFIFFLFIYLFIFGHNLYRVWYNKCKNKINSFVHLTNKIISHNSFNTITLERIITLIKTFTFLMRENLDLRKLLDLNLRRVKKIIKQKPNLQNIWKQLVQELSFYHK